MKVLQSVLLFGFYFDNLIVLVLRNVIFYLDYLSAMFSLGEFFAVLVVFFVIILFRLLFLNRLLSFSFFGSSSVAQGPTLVTTTRDLSVTDFSLLRVLSSVRIFTPRSIV